VRKNPEYFFWGLRPPKPPDRGLRPPDLALGIPPRPPPPGDNPQTPAGGKPRNPQIWAGASRRLGTQTGDSTGDCTVVIALAIALVIANPRYSKENRYRIDINGSLTLFKLGYTSE
jgi:hypothetical protein